MKKALLALAAVAATGLAQATPIFINNGVDWAGDADSSTSTAAFDNLAFSSSKAIAVVYGNALTVGAKVVTTNDASLLSSVYGITTTNNTIPSTYIATPANVNIDELNTTGDGNGFTQGGTAAPYGSGLWGLTYSLTLEGKLASGGYVNYNSGVVNLFYQDGGAAKKVAELDLTSSSNNLNNQVLSGKIDFGFVSALSLADQAFVTNFWNDATTGQTLYSKYLADPIALSWVIDQNNNPNRILSAGPTAAKDKTFGGNNYKYTTVTSGGSVTLNVPEPGSIALVGLVLTGVAVVSRRRKQA
jgi:PEP-CTERM motif